MKSQRRTRRHLHYVAATRGSSSSSRRQPEAAATEASVMELELLPKIATTFGWLASVACHMCCCCKDCCHCHCCCNWGRRHRRICVDNIPNSIREKNIQQLLRCGNRAIERVRKRKRGDEGRGAGRGSHAAAAFEDMLQVATGPARCELCLEC